MATTILPRPLANVTLRGAVVWTVSDIELFLEDYERSFGWLHKGDSAIGQMSF
jgi:hypothetical protein